MSEHVVSAPAFFIGDYGAEDADGGEGEEWFVDWATLDNQLQEGALKRSLEHWC